MNSCGHVWHLVLEVAFGLYMHEPRFSFVDLHTVSVLPDSMCEPKSEPVNFAGMCMQGTQTAVD